MLLWLSIALILATWFCASSICDYHQRHEIEFQAGLSGGTSGALLTTNEYANQPATGIGAGILGAGNGAGAHVRSIGASGRGIGQPCAFCKTLKALETFLFPQTMVRTPSEDMDAHDTNNGMNRNTQDAADGSAAAGGTAAATGTAAAAASSNPATDGDEAMGGTVASDGMEAASATSDTSADGVNSPPGAVPSPFGFPANGSSNKTTTAFGTVWRHAAGLFYIILNGFCATLTELLSQVGYKDLDAQQVTDMFMEAVAQATNVFNSAANVPWVHHAMFMTMVVVGALMLRRLTTVAPAQAQAHAQPQPHFGPAPNQNGLANTALLALFITFITVVPLVVQVEWSALVRPLAHVNPVNGNANYFGVCSTQNQNFVAFHVTANVVVNGVLVTTLQGLNVTSNQGQARIQGVAVSAAAAGRTYQGFCFRRLAGQNTELILYFV